MASTSCGYAVALLAAVGLLCESRPTFGQTGARAPAAAGDAIAEAEAPEGALAQAGSAAEGDPAPPEGSAAPGGSPAQAPGLSPRTTQRVEEIVVTARKRAELLEDVPISVTALGEATLREAGVTRLDDISQLVPNLTFYDGRDGLTSSVFIRGVGQNFPIITFDPGVGIYVDGVFLARAQGSVLDIIDVEQVEVLRGPQGTLFGRNTVGGAISVTTIKPGPELEAFASVRAGNFNTVLTRAMLNVPIAVGGLEDKLFARVAFGSENSDGYTDNTFRDETWSDTNALNFLGSVRFVPTDEITFDLSGSWFRDHNKGKGGECVFIQDTSIMAAFVPNRQEFFEACERTEPYSFTANTAGVSDVESYGVWGTAQWDAGDRWVFENLNLKSITSWREQIPRLREDLEMTLFPVAQRGALGGDSIFDGEPGFAQQISQEVQVTGAALEGDLSYVTGYYVFWENGTEDIANRVFIGTGDALGSSTLNHTSIDNWSWALYGQATYALTDWANLTAGVRYTEEKKGFGRLAVNPFTPDAPPAIDADEDKIFTAWTPMASLALLAPESWLDAIGFDHLLGYFTYSEGFKSGGFNGSARMGNPTQLQPFEPENLTNYEIGVKTIALEQRLTANLSLFYGDYDDIQVQTVLLGPPLQPGGPPTVDLAVRNAAKATTKGLEFEVQALPFDGAQVTGSIAYLDGTYDEFIGESALTGDPIDRAGEAFLFVPDFQSHLSVQYSFPLGNPGPAWLQGWLTPRLDWYYQSSVDYAGPELPQATQSGYNLLHARLSFDFDDDRAQLALWAKNLTDEEYFQQITGSAATFGEIVRFYQPPRTFGVEISYRF
jgi:iron complex outermembrane receptor protein